jgi:hypothetical protein
MKTLIGMAVVTAALALGGPAAVAAAAENAPRVTSKAAAASDVTDFSASRRHYRYGYRSYSRPYYPPDPYYYARPYYYRPYPYSVPAPFLFGLAYDPFQ